MKKYILSWIIAIIITAVLGGYSKSSCTDKLFSITEDTYISFEHTYYLDTSFIENIDDEINSIIESSPFIAKVRYTGNVQYLNNELMFTVNIIKVFKGNNKLTDQTIEYVVDPMALDMNYGFAWGSYVNYMLKDNEYLIFAMPLKDSLVEFDNNMYISTGLRYLPYFNYRDVENKILYLKPLTTKGYESFLGINYYQAKNNEFFVTSQESLNNLLEFKSEIISKFE